MGKQDSGAESELQQQVEELAGQVATNMTAIQHLRELADDADTRADATEVRAMRQHMRMDRIEERADMDRAMLAALQAEGMLDREQSANLHQALTSSRTIGAAVGIIMANRHISETQAFAILVRASQNTNCKLRLVADDIVNSGDVTDLPAAGPEPTTA
ncbi:ANTAR domain-containing protein [Fodinibacter luteus]